MEILHTSPEVELLEEEIKASLALCGIKSVTKTESEPQSLEDILEAYVKAPILAGKVVATQTLEVNKDTPPPKPPKEKKPEHEEGCAQFLCSCK